jgi:hypothetical protein
MENIELNLISKGDRDKLHVLNGYFHIITVMQRSATEQFSTRHCIRFHTFLQNLLNVLSQIASKMGLQKKMYASDWPCAKEMKRGNLNRIIRVYSYTQATLSHIVSNLTHEKHVWNYSIDAWK